MKLLRILTAAAVCAAALSTALAQSIPAPASSVDSSARAMVAIAPVDTSNLATKAEVNNAYNLANSAYSYAGSAYSYAGSAYSYGYAAYTNQGNFGQPWSKYFPGQSRAYSYGSAYIDGGGQVLVASPWQGWIGIGYTSGPASISYGRSGPAGYEQWAAYPTSFDYYGRPTNWTLYYSLNQPVNPGSPF